MAVMAKFVAEVSSKMMYRSFARAHLQLKKPKGILPCYFAVLVINSLEVQDDNTSRYFFSGFYLFDRDREKEHKEGEQGKEWEKQVPHRAGLPKWSSIQGPELRAEA